MMHRNVGNGKNLVDEVLKLLVFLWLQCYNLNNTSAFQDITITRPYNR